MIAIYCRVMRARRHQFRSTVVSSLVALALAGCGVEGTGAANNANNASTASTVTAPLNSSGLPTAERSSTTNASIAPTVVPTTALAPSGRVTMAFSGDVLAHRAINRGARQPDGTYDYAPMFTNAATLISSVDLAICHLESPVGPNGEVIVEPERIAVSATIGVALASAGYDRCSTASNHSLNGGVFGVQATIDAWQRPDWANPVWPRLRRRCFRRSSTSMVFVLLTWHTHTVSTVTGHQRARSGGRT